MKNKAAKDPTENYNNSDVMLLAAGFDTFVEVNFGLGTVKTFFRFLLAFLGRPDKRKQKPT